MKNAEHRSFLNTYFKEPEKNLRENLRVNTRKLTHSYA